jgi:Amt family ammonium transporter
MKTLGGSLGGLVAISACCNAVTAETAIVIGMAAGFVHHVGGNFLQWLGHDDPVGAIPVHGFCGILGTLCVALVADPQGAPGFLPTGGPIHSWLAGFGIESVRLAQLAAQTIGIGVCAAFTGGASWLFFRALTARRSPVEMRVADENEATGALA